MKSGEASQTAVLVCAARAVAHERGLAPGFSDPTALALLPGQARAEVERFRQGPPASMRGRLRYEFAKARAAVMAVRSLFIDEVVREAAPEQLVILGAGLDGRAWRMPELAGTVVYEVDHPDSQRYKRAHVTELTQRAREVKFVAVDFTRDDLAHCLEAAGHDAARPTTFIWEGVVMYLTPAEVEATLAQVGRRSAPGSRLLIVYHAPGKLVLRLVGLLVRRLGEPLRSTFDRAQMQALLARHAFSVHRDEDLPQAAERLAPRTAGAVARVRHMRLVSAERRPRAGREQ